MKSVKYSVKVALLLSTAMIRMAAEDFPSFLQKVRQKLAESLRFPHWLVRKIPTGNFSNTEISKLFHQGELRAVTSVGNKLVLEKRLSVADKRKVARAGERLAMLEFFVATRRRQSSPSPGFNLRVVFYLSNSLPYTSSGYTFRSQNTLVALREAGVRVSAMTRLAYPLLIGKWPRNPVDYIDGVPYFRQLPLTYPSTLQERHRGAVRLLVDHLRSEGATVLHTTTDYNNGLVAAEAASILGIPWVYEVRGELESTWLSRFPAAEQCERSKSDFYVLSRKQETACMKAADAVIVLSQISRDDVIARGIDPAKVTVVPNAVEIPLEARSYAQKEIRQELGLEDKPTVGCVTSVVDYEGLDDLLRAAALTPEVNVLIVGDGTARGSLQRLADELGIVDRVNFVGRKSQSEIWKWYAALDAFVVPRKDTEVCRKVTPIKAMLAQGLGVPVIASDLPALREITGGLASYVEPENPERLAVAMKEIVDRGLSGVGMAQSSNIGPQMILNKKWAEEHSWSANASRYMAVYERVVREGG